MKITRAVVPSLFTVLNMFCGFFSIIHSSKSQYETAAWLIILGAIFDAFDGIMARITKSSSKFGVEFDSLSDLITFGAAPSFLVYNIYFNSLEGLGILISSMLLIFGGIRLARFNVQLVGFDKDYFKGLPIPAQAIMISTFVLSYYTEIGGIIGWKATALFVLVVSLSLLMVSNFKYDTLPKFTRRNIKEQPIKFAVFVAASAVVAVTGGRAIFPLFLLYTLSGVIRYVISSSKKILHIHKKSEESEAENSGIDI
ncbi:MAG: CDP-diacylglycerol--serine O-phosphatidyltransferase [Ignavibacteriae bacterium]|nr:MAG: CDP-diacylglycerol--serine O-phosphatidyltransferase [Ignavibacteriota bacterium]